MQAHYQKFVKPAMSAMGKSDKAMVPDSIRRTMLDNGFAPDDFDSEIMTKNMPRWHKGTNDALRFLKKEGMAKRVKSGWSLTDKGRQAVSGDSGKKTIGETLSDILADKGDVALSEIYELYAKSGRELTGAWKASVRKSLQDAKRFVRVTDGVFRNI